MYKTTMNSAVVAALLLMGALLPQSGHCLDNPWKWQRESWGRETNGVKAGLYFQRLSLGTNSDNIRCTPVLLNTRTNPAASSQPDRLRLWLPPKDSCYQLSLMDSNQQPVPRTALGRALGKPITEPLMLTTGVNLRAGYTGQILIVGTPEQTHHSFLLRDYFAITAPGRYRVKLDMRVVWVPPAWKESLKTTKLPVVELPPVEAEIDVK